MPVYKYRSIEQMKADSKRIPPGHPSIARRIRHLWQLSGALTEVGIPRGVHKYRSIEEMDAARNQWDRARVERAQRRFGT